MPILQRPPDPSVPLSRLTLADQVRDRIREAVIRGDLPQGTPVSEPALAQRFGVSRAPIREALIALEREGLVTFDDRGRTRIIELTPKLFEELVTVRVALEGAAARLAATRGDACLKAELTENVGLQAIAATYRQLTRLDVAFHETFIRAAGNDRLLAAWLTVRSVLEFWLTAAFRDADLAVEPRELAVRSHQRLLAAIVSGGADRAEKAAVAHITGWRSYLRYARPTLEEPNP
ncbi:MAG: GntR family transcriptional regulator [Gemmataceae bacterium]|nr:GntR family transcriptional regulator [Gemmataceae bacterium]